MEVVRGREGAEKAQAREQSFPPKERGKETVPEGSQVRDRLRKREDNLMNWFREKGLTLNQLHLQRQEGQPGLTRSLSAFPVAVRCCGTVLWGDRTASSRR